MPIIQSGAAVGSTNWLVPHSNTYPRLWLVLGYIKPLTIGLASIVTLTFTWNDGTAQTDASTVLLTLLANKTVFAIPVWQTNSGSSWVSYDITISGGGTYEAIFGALLLSNIA